MGDYEPKGQTKAKDITDEVEQLTGSAGPNYNEGNPMPGSLGNVAGYYQPPPGDIARREREERQYRRQNLLNIASSSFGDKLPLVSAQDIVERAREFQTFMEQDD